MQLKKFAFQKLPFSSLFQTYTSHFEQLAPFYEVDPFNEKAITAGADTYIFKGDRSQAVQGLLDFNQPFNLDEAALQNIHRLKEDDALAIVTGQQLGVYGGPLFTMFKVLTAIQLAHKWEQKLQRPVIPVFWMADEDHDYEEVRSLSLLNGEGVESFALPARKDALPPVSELIFPDQLTEVGAAIRAALVDTDFSNDLWHLLDSCFKPGRTFAKGFGSFISHLFSKHGLVLAGSHHPAIKKQIRQGMLTAVQKSEAIREALEKQSQKLEQRFHRQVTLYDSHLFYLDPQKGRIKINHLEDQWQVETDHQWTTQQLLDEIDEHPERFSPDVFLRPILQDTLLPTLGYVGGPGEVAYYGQMKLFYQCFDKEMPVIFPRLSATFIEPAIDRIFHELPFELHEYNNRIEDLESDYVKQAQQEDIEAIFKRWKEQSRELAAPHNRKIKAIDETLEGAAKKIQAHYFNELNELKGKTYSAVKKHKNTQLKRIHRIQHHFFPGLGMQERTLSGIYYMNKFGPDIWDWLLDTLHDEEIGDAHKLIYL